MNLDDFSRVASAALAQIDQLLFQWLPNGVIDGHEFCIGSRDGEAGKSLRIRLSGRKAGYWSEFSSDGEAGRDLISLYAYIHGVKQGKACAEIAEQLGIQIAGESTSASGSKPSRPQKSAPAQAAQGVGAPSAAKPKTEWEPLLPVPEDAGPPPVAHINRGRPEKTWTYRDQMRRVLGVIYRFKTSDGGKEVLPCVFARHPTTGVREWRWMQFPVPRPLYLPGALRPGLPVLVVEGEKCADVAYELLQEDWDVVSWPGGGKAVDKADWEPLRGRTVVLWPDADAKTYKEGHPLAGQVRPEREQPGIQAMAKIEEILLQLECIVRTVAIPAPDAPHHRFAVGEPGHDGFDIADLVAAGADRAEVDSWLDRLRDEGGEAGADAQAVEGDEVPDWVTGPAGEEGAVLSSGLSASTPRAACAGGMTRRQIRNTMIAGSTPGSVKGCRENVYTALMHDPCLKGLVALDQFAMRQVKRKNAPWVSEPGEWTEGDDFHLGLYLSQHYGLVIASIGDIEKAVAQSARENGFNPVIDLFEACAAKWDGQPRVEEAFATYWSAPASDYMRCVSRMFFVGLAKRAYVPGVKHDDAPVFEGGQGEGKSTALAVLGGDWFADTPFRMGEKDGYLAIQGILIYEIAELEQFNRAEVTAVKAFMSSQKDRYREPYGRRMVNQPRRTVFAATTNEGQYFKDTTGNRRFWPVETGRIDLDGLRRDRGQLLGEAVHMMRAGVKWFPTRDEQQRLISPVQGDREIWDEWAGRVWEYLEGKDIEGNDTALGRRNDVTARELLTRALHIEIGKISNAKTETMRISNIMRKLGWLKRRQTGGAREWYYERPQDEKAPAQPAGDLPDWEEGHDLPI